MGNDLSIWTLVLDASAIVQAVMVLLWSPRWPRGPSFSSKGRVIAHSRAPGRSIRDGILVRRRSVRALPQHRDQGARGHRASRAFSSPVSANSAGCASWVRRRDQLLEGARRAMRVAQMREMDRLERQSRDAGHGRLHQPVRGPVRHGVGHHECVPQSRQCAAGDPGGGGAGHRRGADRDRDRPVRRDSRGGCLQPVCRSGQPPGTALRHLRRRVLDASCSVTGPPVRRRRSPPMPATFAAAG